jgi:hypothetical protein
MATQSPMGITGRIGNVIHYQMNGKYYMRSAPRKFKQTKATKKRATEFGKASSIGAAIREQLRSVISNPTDNKMQTRLVSLIFEWLQSGVINGAELSYKMALINEFEFIEKGGGIRQRLMLPLQVSNPSPGLVQIEIPAFVPKKSIKAPAQTVSVICNIATGVCDVATGRAKGGSSAQLIFTYDSTPVAAQTISMKLPTPKRSLIVTGVSLEYKILKYGKSRDNENKAFMPAGFVHAMFV